MGKNIKMSTPNEMYDEIDKFRDALIEDNISVQVEAIKMLPALAASMDSQRAREVLVPCVVNCVDAMPEESLFNLAEQLELLVPFVGGNEHAKILLDILSRLACEDEVLVRNKALEAMKSICDSLDNEQCEASFYPIIEKMVASDWFTQKCSAGSLIAICYSKMSPEKQKELRDYFRVLVQDDGPMVRRSTATSLVDLIPFLDVEEIKSEFVPIFDNLAQDDQDSVRTLSVDVGIAISKTLKDFEVYDFLLRTFKMLGEEDSWRVRQRIAWKIHELQITETNRSEIIAIFNQCVTDKEPEVRVLAAKNVYNLTANVLEGFKKEENYQDNFEKFFEESIFPEIHLLLRDESDEVRVALSTNILSLSVVLRNECFNTNILPLIIDALENEEYIPFKENMLKNLNFLPQSVDITKSLKSIRDVFQNLMKKSQMHWRTRRNLLLGLMHITKNTTSEFFTKNMLVFYQFLLEDQIYAVRRTATVILPLLVKHFGVKWAQKSLFPIFRPFVTDEKYLYKFITLFAIEELISPTLNQKSDNDGEYLKDFVEMKSKRSVETLIKIAKLNAKLEKELGDKSPLDANIVKNDVQFYAEDTLDNLKKEYQSMIFSISVEEIEECYLEGVLTMLVKDFVQVVKQLMDDDTENVRHRAKVTLKIIETFHCEVKKELEQEWVQERLSGVSKDDLKRIDEEIEVNLVKLEEPEDVEMIDCHMDGTETEPEENIELEQEEIEKEENEEREEKDEKEDEEKGEEEEEAENKKDKESVAI